MKNLLKLLFVFTLVFNSCSKDNNDDIVNPTQINTSESLKTNLANYSGSANGTNQDSRFLDDCDECLSLIYPVTVLVGNEEVVANSQEELGELDFEEFVFPMNVLLEGETVTLNDMYEFFGALEACFGPFDDSDEPVDPTDDIACFSLNFPVTAIDCDGSEIVLESEGDLIYNCTTDFVYPLSVTLEDGSEATINSDEEFDELYNDCYGIDDCEDCAPVCFEILFPISFTSESGEVATVNSPEELAELFENSNEGLTVNYPVNVALEDGSVEAINSDEEFEALFESCL